VANWEGLACCEDYQTKGHGTKGKHIMDFKKDVFIAEISQLLQKDAIFGHSEKRKLLNVLYLAKCVRFTVF